jgi:hypothetical protein
MLVDYRKFERKLKWKEFFSGKEEEVPNDWKPKEKTNLPPKSSNNLKNFLSGIKSELIGTEFNKAQSYLPKDKEEAIKTLVTLQKNSCFCVFYGPVESSSNAGGSTTSTSDVDNRRFQHPASSIVDRRSTNFFFLSS